MRKQKMYNLGQRGSEEVDRSRKRHWFWHRWNYTTVQIEHLPDVASTRCDAHPNSRRHINTKPVRFCFSCKQLQGEDLPGGEAYTWDDWHLCIVSSQGEQGMIRDWKWPLLEDVMARFLRLL